MPGVNLEERLSAALMPHYHIERELGGGGMSRVFVAKEVALGRRVAIKVLDGAHELSAERFAREIRLAARLQHPNIVPLLNAGVADGHPFYTMPFVDGQTLRQRMRDTLLPIGEVISVLRDLARALAFAHREGVVHRDIKPENILFSSGAAVVTDFGIAKAYDRAIEVDSAKSSTITTAGSSIGTPAYMAPEQCAGDPVDQRADIYAWGVVAFELLAGQHPFPQPRTVRELMTAHLLHDPAYHVLRGESPVALVELVRRCQEKDPELRPKSGEALLAALDSIVTGETGAQWASVEMTTDNTPSVAVLPFSNSSGNAQDDFFADGISEEIMSALAHVRGLRVAARTSCFAFKGQRVDLRAMAEQLGVATVLEGTVRRAGERVRVSTNLVDAQDGLSLWAGRFDREFSDLFVVQDEIAYAIAETLGTTLRETMRRSRSTKPGRTDEALPPVPGRQGPSGPSNVEAYEAYLRGRLFLDQRSTDIAQAVASFEEAAAKDPSLSVAHAGLAHVYTWLGLWYIAPASYAFDKVKTAADRAIALNPNDAVAYAANAVRALWHEWNSADALRLAQRAIDIAPGLPLGHSVMTYVRIARGEFDDAIRSAERALTLDPLSNAARTDLSDALRFAGRLEEAMHIVQPVVNREPNHILGNLWLAYQLDASGKADQALPFVERAVAASNRSPALVAVQARLLARAGRPAEARETYDELLRRRASEFVAPFLLAVASVEIEPADVTFAWLDEAVTARDCHVTLLHREYFWAPISSDARFAALISTIGIATV